MRVCCVAAPLVLYPVSVNTGKELVFAHVKARLIVYNRLNPVVVLLVISVFNIELVKRYSRTCIGFRVDLLAIPRNELIDIFACSCNFRSCIFVNENAQHEILVIGSIAILINNRRKLSIVVKVYFYRRIAFCCTCEKVFKNLVAEADRQSHCSSHEATEQSLEQ